MLLPMSQKWRRRGWVYYHRWYPYHHIYGFIAIIGTPGYWYAGCWCPGLLGLGGPPPVVVVAPY